jgi:MarR family transcriptional regulator, transcriptional regulator for hemolysin
VRPTGFPIGLRLARTSKAVGRAFNDALAAAGGSVPVWLILANLAQAEWPTQLELARAVDIEGPTLTRHLDGLAAAGLVVRRAHPGDRRAVQVELTEAGQALHAELLRAVIAFNRRLTKGLAADELGELDALLVRLGENVR